MTTETVSTTFLAKELEKEVLLAIKEKRLELRVFCRQMKNTIRVGIHQFEKRELSAWIDVSEQVTLSIRDSHRAHLPNAFLQLLSEIVETKNKNTTKIIPSCLPQFKNDTNQQQFDQKSFDQTVDRLNRRYGEGNWCQADLDDELG